MSNRQRMIRTPWKELMCCGTDVIKHKISMTDRNPGRGFYHVYTYDLAVQEAEEDWIWSLCREERLALVLLDIGAAGSRSLKNEEVEKAGRILQLFADAGMEMILRIVYDREGQGLQREPESVELICEHMRQLGAVIKKYAAHIFTLQGLFIGSWGEMHDSSYLEKDVLRHLYKTLYEATGGMVRLAVRKPQYQRQLRKGISGDGEIQITTGLYDDAILGSENDMGTFGWIDDTTDPDIMWTPEQELDFIERQRNGFICGGEILSGALEHTNAQVLERLRRMHVTYLNSVHEPCVWEQWKHKPSGIDPWLMYDYIREHLGYRYRIENVYFEEASDAADGFQDPVDVHIQLSNEGFAPAVDELSMELLITDEKEQVLYRRRVPFHEDRDTVHEIVMRIDQVENVIKQEQTQIFWLRLLRDRDQANIYFANLYDKKWLNTSFGDAFCVGTLVSVTEPSS